jgi:hypothetical protein
MIAEDVLDAVENWACGATLIREIELLGNAPEAEKGYNQHHRDRMAKAFGRLDGLLVPMRPWDCPWYKKRGGWIWRSACLVGVEVKVSLADFKNGLKKGQFDRYGDNLGALYIATPAKLVKTSEIPKQFGHLVVRPRKAHHDGSVAGSVRGKRRPR